MVASYEVQVFAPTGTMVGAQNTTRLVHSLGAPVPSGSVVFDKLFPNTLYSIRSRVFTTSEANMNIYHVSNLSSPETVMTPETSKCEVCSYQFILWGNWLK